MKKIYAAMAVCIVFVLSGCATSVKMNEFKSMDCDLKECDVKLPDYILNKKKPRIVIAPLEDTTQFGGKLSKPAQESLSQLLSDGCGLEVLERGQIGNLFKEFKFGESLGSKVNYSNLTKFSKDVDYVLVGSITAAHAGASFSEARHWVDKKGQSYYNPPSCTVAGEATVNIRTIATASGSVHKVLHPYKGQASGSTEVRSTSECRVNNPEQIIESAVAKAIEKAKFDLQDAFPNYGYISKTMTNPNNPKARIAFISLGKNDGIKANDRLVIAKFEKTVDRVKKTTEMTIFDLGEVAVNATGLHDNECIVTIPEEISNEVIAGYIVKTKANRSFFNKLGTAMSN